jgi:hypothetical protein
VKRGLVAALVMAALLALYLVLVAQHAIVLLGTGVLAGQLEGVALIVLPIVGAWALIAELVFGARAQRLLRLMTERGALPVDDLPHRPSGRPERAAADAEFKPLPRTGPAGTGSLSPTTPAAIGDGRGGRRVGRSGSNARHDIPRRGWLRG